MVEIPLELVGAVTGIIGTITGIISLVWLISKNKPKLKLERAHFHHYGKADGKSYNDDFVKVAIVLRNLSHRSTTVDGLFITYGSVQTPDFFRETTIPASSSKTLIYTLAFGKGDLKKFSFNGKTRIGLDIIHTFGVIRRKAEIPFGNEYYNF